MIVTLNIPEDLASQLNPVEDKLPQILELGLRELNATAQFGFEGAADVLEFLANLPTPEETLALRPSQSLQERISTLLEKNRATGLSETEEQEWKQYEYLEHLVRIAKAKAHLKLRSA